MVKILNEQEVDEGSCNIEFEFTDEERRLLIEEGVNSNIRKVVLNSGYAWVDGDGIETVEIKFDSNKGWPEAIRQLIIKLTDERRLDDMYHIDELEVMALLENYSKEKILKWLEENKDG